MPLSIPDRIHSLKESSVPTLNKILSGIIQKTPGFKFMTSSPTADTVQANEICIYDIDDGVTIPKIFVKTGKDNLLEIPDSTGSSPHNAVTIGTASGLSMAANQVLSLAVASGSVTGAISSTDWTTFNNKQTAITGTATNVLYLSGASTVAGNQYLTVNSDGLLTTRMQAITVSTKTGAYPIATGDYFLRCNGTFTVTLPAATATGRLLYIKNVGTGDITIAPAGGETIDGDSSITVGDKYSTVALCDGSSGNWDIL